MYDGTFNYNYAMCAICPYFILKVYVECSFVIITFTLGWHGFKGNIIKFCQNNKTIDIETLNLVV